MTKLPTIHRSRPNSSSQHPLWLRITAFLSMKAPNTQRTYRGIVSEWCEFLGGEIGAASGAQMILAATDLHAVAYRRWLEEKIGQAPRLSVSQVSNSREIVDSQRVKSARRDGLQHTLSNATIAKKFAALRRLYRVLIAADIGVRQNPFDTDRVPAPSLRAGQKRPTEMVVFSLVQTIISLPDIKTPRGLRDRAILAILFGGGLRRSELCQIRLGDIKRSQQGTVYVHLRATKAKRDADQALPEWAVDPLLQLLDQRISSGASSGDYLFQSYAGRGGNSPTPHALSDKAVYRVFKHYCALAGAGPHLTPHSARATAITKLLSDGVPHREVQEFSRHSSVAMVEVYDKRRLSIEQNPGRKLKY
jgi:integrase/recombinase XerD